jgi:DNA topoisomerase-2
VISKREEKMELSIDSDNDDNELFVDSEDEIDDKVEGNDAKILPKASESSDKRKLGKLGKVPAKSSLKSQSNSSNSQANHSQKASKVVINDGNAKSEGKIKVLKSSAKYRLSDRDHMLHRPDMYISTVESEKCEEWVAFNVRNESGDANQAPIQDATKQVSELRVERREMLKSTGVLKIFLEILSNALDNMTRSKKKGVPTTKIIIYVNAETGETSIYNNGAGFSLTYVEDLEVYKPTLFLSYSKTSTNYNDNKVRTIIGRNGFGAKLTNVYSTSLSIETYNENDKKIFRQRFLNNMGEREEPQFEDISKVRAKLLKIDYDVGFTKITWKPDFKLFKVKGYSADMIDLFRKYACDAAMVSGIPIIFNGERIRIKSLQDYAKMFIGDNKEMMEFKSKDSEVILCSSEEFHQISFVNKSNTIRGGVHVDAWIKAILTDVAAKLNVTLNKKDNKDNSDRISVSMIKENFCIFINCTLDKPKFDIQTKERLLAPEPTVSVPQEASKTILSWKFVEYVNEQLRLKLMKRVNAKKSTKARLEKLIDASKVKEDPMKCIMILTEGDSAKASAKAGVSGLSEEDAAYFGIYPLRGKFLNVKPASVRKITENKVIKELFQILGLVYGRDYADLENMRTLRYGSVLLITDQDKDGYHIRGLFMNFIYSLFPTLAARHYIKIMNTPLIKATLRGEETREFFDMIAYKQWESSLPPGTKVTPNYYKGLGSSDPGEFMDYFQRYENLTKSVPIDEEGGKYIDMAFSKEKDSSEERKEWIGLYNPTTGMSDYEIEGDENDNNNAPAPVKAIQIRRIASMSVKHFVNSELVKYAVEDNERSIPNVIDGLKDSQRKILFASFKRKMGNKEVKVVNLGGYVAENTDYKHGPDCLNDTIILMSQSYVGSNNIPFFKTHGQFGTRDQLGADAAQPRYIFVCDWPIIRKIFKEEDTDILMINEEERLSGVLEPLFYVPVIPMVLVNGCKGIGMGWATTIPPYNPRDLISWIRAWLKGEETPELIPWYLDFTGEVKLIKGNKAEINGVFEESKGNVYTITEIPVTISTESYKKILYKLEDEKVIKIKKMDNGCHSDKPSFTVISKEMKLNHKILGLTDTISLNNLVAFNSKGRLKKYESIDDIMEEFCKVRMIYYVKRKQHLLLKLEADLAKHSNKLRFLKAIISEEIKIKNENGKPRSKADFVKDLDDGNYLKIDDSYKYLLSIPLSSITEDKIKKLEDQIASLEAKIEELRGKTLNQLWLDDLEDFEKAYPSFLTELRKIKAVNKKGRTKP